MPNTELCPGSLSQSATLEHISIKSQPAAENLIKLIKQLFVEGEYEGVALLFSSPTEAERNIESLKIVATDVLRDICKEYLNDVNYEKNMALYDCAEQLLRTVAKNGPAEELLLELLEMVEEEKSDNVFTSTLKALQIILLRLFDRKPRAIEWSLNSIQNRIAELPIPNYLNEGYDIKQERLLEQDDQVLRILMNYITIGLFYEPLLKKLKKRTDMDIFHSNKIDSRNVLCCFLVQILGRPLALLDLSTANTEQRSNTYTTQCACSIAKVITECLTDPLYLLSFAEKRVRWKHRLNPDKGVFEMSSENIFLIDEKLPLIGLAIYYYMVIVERVTFDCIPKVYTEFYIFEACLYLVVELLNQAEPPLHYRGLLLGKRLMELLQQEVPAVELELIVHKTFCNELCNIIGFSPQKHLRQEGVQLLRMYILKFDHEGKYLILRNLLSSIGHTGIGGFLIVIYKDLVANALLSLPSSSIDDSLPIYFSGDYFRDIFLEDICYLPNGATTDIIDQADKIISSLNAVRFFALKDLKNRTGFWNFADVIEKQFLSPLLQGLQISKAHYKSELENVERNLENESKDEQREHLKLLEINIANDTSDRNKNKSNLELSRKQKIEILTQDLCALDLVHSLLARVTECLESSVRNYRNKN